MMFYLSFLLFLMFSQCMAAKIPKIVDLSYVYNEDTPNFPLHSKFQLKPVKDVIQRYGIWVGINDLCTSEHSGTHTDAPQHFVKGARTVENIPIEKLYRLPAVKIDIRHKIKDNVNYAVTADDIREFIAEHGPLPDGSMVLFQTGYGLKSHDADMYSGMDANGGMNFPGLGKSAAEFLVSYKAKNNLKRGVVGVGLDVLSLDIGRLKEGFPAHYELLGNDIYGLENVANVHMLPPKDFYVTVSPMKIGNGSGGPTRIFAEIVGSNASALGTQAIYVLLSLFVIFKNYF